MGAILLSLLSYFVLVSKCQEEPLDQPVNQQQCAIDPRVATLRCVAVPFESIKDALNQLDLTSVQRIDILRSGDFNALTEPLITKEGQDVRSIIEIKIVDSGLAGLGESSLNGFHDHLESIDLSWNDLVQVPEVVLKLGKLRHLDLSHNKIFALPPGSSFNSLNALATLKLNGNRLGWTKEGEADEDENSSGQSPKLSLLSFNLEPLTDTLERLELSDNRMTGLPMQFQGRSFPRLRHLDLSHNPIKELPEGSFSEMEELEWLNLDHTGLRTLILTDESLRLKMLQFEGNPLQCDCHARWLWGFARSNVASVKLPKCATPYSAREIPLTSLSAEDLCELLPSSDQRPPRFYRLSQKDEPHFPPQTFSSLNLHQVKILNEESVEVAWEVKLDYYYTDYDWGIIYRRIGSGEDEFYQTRHNLKAHLEANPNWSPKTENLTGLIGALSPQSYYEVCLAVVEHSTIYYVHRGLCSEVTTSIAQPEPHQDSSSWVSTKNLSIVPSENSLTLAWQIAVASPHMPPTTAAKNRNSENNNDLISVIRQISIREFGSENATQLFVLEDFNKTLIEGSKSDASRFYTLPNLTPDSAYIVCFDTLENSQVPKGADNCKEVKTLKPKADFITSSFPTTEVAIASIVSAILSAIIALLCCFFILKSCQKKPDAGGKQDVEKSQSNSGDANQNLDSYETNPKFRAQLKPEMVVEETPVEVLKRTPSARSISMSTSIATTFEPELQVLNTEESNKETEEELSSSIRKKPSKFAERYSTQSAPKDTNNNNSHTSEDNTGKNLRFWKACLNNGSTNEHEQQQKAKPSKSSLKPSDKKEVAKADKFAEAQDYLRRPNVLYPPWPSSSQPTEQYSTLPHNHLYKKVHPPEMYGPGSYHTIAHYQMYKRPYHHHHHVDFCPHAHLHHHQEVYHNNKHFMSLEPPIHDYAQTLGRTRRESPMATKAIDMRPVKLKKMIKAKMLLPPPNFHHHHVHHEDHHHHMTKMLTWSPYSSQFYDLHHSHGGGGGGKSLDELRF